MQNWLNEQSVLPIFVAVCLAALGFQYWWLRRVKFAQPPVWTWVLTVLLIGLGWRVSEHAGRRERDRIQRLTEDFARLYGYETEKRGHWRLPSDVAPNDPLYLNLVEAQKTWEKLNPGVSDIYTIRKLPNGTNILLVDSETDYNRNGKYDEEREQRTVVGEVYNAAVEGLERALRGQPNFDFAPTTDRWGTWVSAYVPLHDPSGRVEAVLGVDFDAQEFSSSIWNAKVYVLSLVGLLQLGLLGASTYSSILKAQIAHRKKVEVSLRLLGSAVEQARDAIVVTDAELDLPGPKILFVNPAFTRMTGYAANEVLGKTPRILQGPRTDKAVLSRLRQKLTHGETFEGETVNYRKDRSEFNLEWQIAPIRDAAGRITNFVAIQRDITERKRAQEALRESEERFRQMAENVNEVFWMSDPSTTRILYVSPAYERIWGRTCQSLYEQPRSFLDAIQADDRPGFIRALEEQKARGHFEHEYRVVRPDGEVRWIWDRGFPVRSPAGELVRVVGIAQDITARRRAEDALRESERRFSEMMQRIELVAMMLDREARITYCNDHLLQVTGWQREEVVGRNWFEVFVPPDRTELRHVFDALIENRPEAWHHENEILTRAGKRRLIRWNNSVLRSVSGEVIGTASIGEDITERNRLEAQLFRSQKLETVGRLAGGVAHEFNSIMTAIIGQSELLLSDLPLGDPLNRNAREIRKAADRAAALTRQLLAYGRKQIFQPEVLNLNHVLSNMEGVLRNLMGAAVDVRAVPADGLKLVKVDVGQIEQVIMNMAINARDAMPAGGKMTIETSNVTVTEQSIGRDPELKPGDYVVLAITDTGAGMTEEVRHRVFEPFFTTKEVGKGAGLGLATCYGIVKQSGGHISVYSEPGKGSAFKVYLPQIESPTGAPTEVTATSDLPRGTEIILLVEDDPALREMATMLLQRLGYEVLTAADGAGALQVVQQNGGQPLNLLFTDVVMPQMDGIELSDRVKALHPEVKVLFASAYTENAIIHQGVLQSGVALLQKPFTPSALAQKIRAILDAD